MMKNIKDKNDDFISNLMEMKNLISNYYLNGINHFSEREKEEIQIIINELDTILLSEDETENSRKQTLQRVISLITSHFMPFYNSTEVRL